MKLSTAEISKAYGSPVTPVTARITRIRWFDPDDETTDEITIHERCTIPEAKTLIRNTIGPNAILVQKINDVLNFYVPTIELCQLRINEDNLNFPTE